MDGGASSTDAFRMPAEGEELTTPFSEFVVRYGHSPRLVRNMAAIAGVAAELPPRMEEPYRLVYFVVTDQMRTTIAALRAVLKEGIQAPLRTPTAFIIDELHTLEVFRKQGLATSLTNFVKGIAEAHGVELFVSSELYIRSFWELRGFEEETSPEVLRACSLDLDDGFKTGASTTLLRAGAAYTEYQPANDERLSITRPFYHGRDGYAAAAAAPTLAGSAAFMGQGGAGLESSGYGEGIGACAAAAGAVSGGTSAAAGVAGDHNRGTGGGGGAGGETVLPPSSRLLTNERLARHDEEEKAKGLASPWGTLVQSSKTAEATILSTAGDTAAAKAALATAAATAAAQDPSAAAQHTAAGGEWPGAGMGGAAELPPSPSPPPPIGTAAGPAAAAALAATSSGGVGATVAGMLGWTPSDRQIVAATGGTASGGGGDGIVDRRTLAARGLLAIPSSGSRDGVVDLTGGSRSLAEQDEEQMQLAIAMSLSAAAAEATCGGGGDAAAAAAIERSDGARHDGAVRGGEGETSAGDDTETEEDADYGGQLLGGDADATAGGIASSAGAAAVPTSSSARSQVRAGEERGAGGGDGSGCGGGGGGWGRRPVGVVEDGRGRDNDNDGVSRRLRRRRDESGSSTPGEPSPCGADGAASVGMELDGVGAGRHGNEGRRSSSRDVGDDGNTASLTENVCITAARDVGSGLGVASETTAPHAPRPLDAEAAAAREGNSNLAASLPPSLPASPCPSSASSCSFTLEPVPSRSRTSTWNQQQPTTVGALGHRDPNSAMTASKENDPHHYHHHHHHQDHGRKAVYQPPPRGLGARGQQHQHQAAFAGDGGGMIGALGGVVYSPTTAGGTGGADVPGLGAGQFGNVGVGGGGGGLISDGIEPSDVMMRDFGVGADGLDGGGRLDDKLIAVAGWEGDDSDEELRRVMEASRQSHEKEMIQRATQESQQAAAAAAAAAARSNTAAAAAPSSSLPPLSRKGVAAATPNGGGPDVAVLPSFGSLEARESTGVGVGAGVHGHGSDASGAALPSTCGGAAASSSGFRPGAGGVAADSAAVAAAAAAAATGAQAPAWLGGWEDGEAVSFTGKGKGKGRCRD